ncbi:hypothetical protein KY285_013386 [Solanum tuberosum]|nr:hypothetical protein KY289_014075 [Solanum tuberosum]KAH0717355.1 hypothetical protein KY285_013386 [Solanum tuberosum]
MEITIIGVSEAHFRAFLGSFQDALANLATTMTLEENETTKVRVSHRWVIPGCLDLQINESHHIYVRVVEDEDWRKPLVEYLNMDGCLRIH